MIHPYALPMAPQNNTTTTTLPHPTRREDSSLATYATSLHVLLYTPMAPVYPSTNTTFWEELLLLVSSFYAAPRKPRTTRSRSWSKNRSCACHSNTTIRHTLHKVGTLLFVSHWTLQSGSRQNRSCACPPSSRDWRSAGSVVGSRSSG